MILRVVDGGTESVLGPAEFPVPVGGAGSPFQLPDGTAPVAWLGLDQGEVFVQTDEAALVFCNDVRLESSHWLRPGDVLRSGDFQALFSTDEEGLAARVLRPATPTLRQDAQSPPLVSKGATSTDAMGIAVRPIPFRPTRLVPPPRRRRGVPVGLVLGGAAFVVIAAVAFFLSTSRVVSVEIDPTPDRLTFRGPWPALPLPGRFLVRPGRYVLVAEKSGYVRLEKAVDVGSKAGEALRFTLERTPGRLTVDTGDVKGAEVFLDGKSVGRTPLPAFEAPPGEREIVVRAEGYLPGSEKVSVQGSGVLQKITLALVANHAAVSFDSSPRGAAVSVDGTALGTTPLTGSVGAGSRTATFSLAGFRPATRAITVVAGQPVVVPTVSLAPADTHLTLTSEPTGATVSVDGTWRGETPLELDVPPSRVHEVRLTKAGHDAVSARVEASGGERRAVHLTLAPQHGQVEVRCKPPDAELLVDGTPKGRADQTLVLTAIPHELVIRKMGFVDHKQTVTPRPGVPQAIRVTLASVEVRESKARPKTSRPVGSGSDTMRTVPLGPFEVGAARREPGRRTNEALRSVELERPALIGIREVTNAEFRRFRAAHDSGAYSSHPLNADSHPVVRVAWDDAAAYCNWLSTRESLPPFYVQKGGRFFPGTPAGTGYRLPTEAEWERSARFVAAGGPLRFPWGETLPPTRGAGNFADRSARGLVPVILEDYDDGFPATAPCGRFSPGALGLLDMGGNVAEWIQDLYAINPVATGAGPAKDPLGPESGEFHVIRGSSFLHSTVSELRLTYRDYGKDPRPDLGFRIARYTE